MPATQPAPQAQRPTLSQQDREVVSGVFAQLQSIFPAWKHAFPTDERLASAKREFAKALIENGITSLEQIARGMRQARAQDIPFFPAPGMFIKWCELTPESMGLPSLAQAFDDAARRRISHPAVTLAARATRFEAQTLTADEYRPVFEQAYMQLVRRVMDGEDLEAEILKALPTREQIKHSPEHYRETGLKNIARLKRLIVGNPGTNTNQGEKS
jgi:hypothetical protein